MCYNPNDLPPDPSSPATSEANGNDLVLVAADGTNFNAFFAHPATPSSNAHVIIYPDVRGLHNFYKELAMRFAAQGIHALAIDYFGRTTTLHTPRDDSFDFMPHVQQIGFPAFLTDVQAAVAYLQDHHTSSGAKGSPALFTLGFCMGGSLSLLTAAEELPISGAVAFYSGFTRRFPGTDSPTLDRTSHIRVPVLGLYGGADQGIPQSAIDQLAANLRQAGVDHEIQVYPDAPHSFFDRKATDYSHESADAWERVLAFIAAHSRT